MKKKVEKGKSDGLRVGWQGSLGSHHLLHIFEFWDRSWDSTYKWPLSSICFFFKYYKLDGKSFCSNISTTALRQWGFRECLPFSWTTLRGKHCRQPIAVMGVVDTFGPCWTHRTAGTYWFLDGKNLCHTQSLHSHQGVGYYANHKSLSPPQLLSFRRP